MPKQTIYIRDGDIPLFERAQELSDSDALSQVIAEALRRYVAVKEAEAAGMSEYTLEVGIWRQNGFDDVRKVRFIGRFLADDVVHCGQASNHEDRRCYYNLYQTKAGKFVVYWNNTSEWENEDNSADYAVLSCLPDKNHEHIVGKVLGHSVRLPDSVLEEAASTLNQEIVEYIE